MPTSDLERLFPPESREAIRRAVEVEERRTSAEIVPFVANRSDDYRNVFWKSATVGALAAAFTAYGLHAVFEPWGGQPLLWIAAPAVLGAAIGYLLAGIPRLTRALAGSELLDHRVDQRAIAAFLAQEIFATEKRSGLLLYVSLLEHRAVVLADSGIHARVEKAVWQKITDQLAQAVGQGRVAEGLEVAIHSCGDLLVNAGLALSADGREIDRNELSDSIRLESR